jgi:hypothetical protein
VTDMVAMPRMNGTAIAHESTHRGSPSTGRRPASAEIGRVFGRKCLNVIVLGILKSNLMLIRSRIRN